MNIFGHTAGFSKPRIGGRILGSLLSLALVFATLPQNLWAAQDQAAPPPAQGEPAPAQGAPTPPYTQQTPEELQRLVAPIALYPDSLVAQILAASTFPEQVVEADRWVQAHPDLKGTDLGQAVDQQPWDPKREGAGCISVGAGKYGQESFLDVLPRGCLLQPAAGCDGRGAGDAPESARLRQS